MGIYPKDKKGGGSERSVGRKALVPNPMKFWAVGMFIGLVSCTTVPNVSSLPGNPVQAPAESYIGNPSKRSMNHLSLPQPVSTAGETGQSRDGLLLVSKLNRLGDLYLREGQYESAEVLYIQGLAVREKLFGSGHAESGYGIYSLARLYDLEGFFEEAVALYKEALDIFRRQLEPDHPDFGAILSRLASASHGLGRDREAEAYLLQALHIQKKTLGEESQSVAKTMNRLGALYYFQKRYAEAETLLTESIAIQEKKWGPNHSRLVCPLANYAVLLEKMGRTQEAKTLKARSAAIRKMSAQFSSSPPD